MVCENCTTLVYPAITLVGYFFLRKWLQGGQYTKPTRCDGKVIVITGANTGIGKETALDLAKRGGKIYMACRNLVKANKACEDIKGESGSKTVFVRELDLASFESIRNFAKKFKEEENRLDILINNAGIMFCQKSYTKDGLETQIGVNHFGHFLLTHLLLDLLKKSQPSRIINVSSRAHHFGKIKKDDLNSEKSYSAFYNYGQSKLANILFTRELARRLKGTNVTTNSLHPGSVRTELTRHTPEMSAFFNKYVILMFQILFAKTAKSGSQTTLYAALDPDLDNVSGKYFADCKETDTTKLAEDDEMAKWLWDQSEKITKISEKVQ